MSAPSTNIFTSVNPASRLQGSFRTAAKLICIVFVLSRFGQLFLQVEYQNLENIKGSNKSKGSESNYQQEDLVHILVSLVTSCRSRNSAGSEQTAVKIRTSKRLHMLQPQAPDVVNCGISDCSQVQWCISGSKRCQLQHFWLQTL